MNQRLSSSLSTSAKVRSLISLKTIGSLGGILFLTVVFTFQISQTYQKNTFSSTFWNQDIDAVWDKAKTEDKLCFIKFSTPYCYTCDKWNSSISANSKIKQTITDNYVPIEIDFYDENKELNELAQRYDVTSVPTVIITDSDGNEVKRISNLPEDNIWEEVLEETHALRTVPIHASPFAEEMKYSTKKNEITPLQLSDKIMEYGLVVGEGKGYWETVALADRQKGFWENGIWVLPKSKNSYQVVIGPFASKREAKTVRKFLEIWDGNSGKIKPLSLENTFAKN